MYEKKRATSVNFENPTERNREILQRCKSSLQKAYDTISEEELNKLIAKVESAHERFKHVKSWKLINQIIGRKSVKQAIITENYKKHCIMKWYKHFQNLLGKDSVVANELDKRHQSWKS